MRTLFIAISLALFVGCDQGARQDQDQLTYQRETDQTDTGQREMGRSGNLGEDQAGMNGPRARLSDDALTGMQQDPSAVGQQTTDNQLAQQVRQKLGLMDTQSQKARAIQVEVNDGSVTLRGTVKSEQEKQELERQARTVQGITDVDNELDVSS